MLVCKRQSIRTTLTYLARPSRVRGRVQDGPNLTVQPATLQVALLFLPLALRPLPETVRYLVLTVSPNRLRQCHLRQCPIQVTTIQLPYSPRRRCQHLCRHLCLLLCMPRYRTSPRRISQPLHLRRLCLLLHGPSLGQQSMPKGKRKNHGSPCNILVSPAPSQILIKVLRKSATEVAGPLSCPMVPTDRQRPSRTQHGQPATR